MRALLALVILSVGLGVTAAKAAAPPTPLDCVTAYVTLDRVHARERDMNYQSSKDGGKQLNFTGLGRYLPGYETFDFDARARSLAEKHKSEMGQDGFGSFKTTFGISLGLSRDYIDGIMMEANSAVVSSMLAPQTVYQQQEPLFARIRACDIAYGFSPVLPAAPTAAEVIAMIKKRQDADRKEVDDRLNALTDLQCTVRFAGAASLFPAGSPGQTVLQQHYMAGLNRLQPTMNNLPQERVKELLEREMTELSGFLQRKVMTPRDLVEQVNFCERKFDLPMTPITLNN